MSAGGPGAGSLVAALEGRYRIERELGGGGMSRVFLAKEIALDREVVVKVLAAELVAGASAERFTREIATAARLQQANIVPVLSAGEAAGLAYYTMPFVRGESLRARLGRAEPVPIGEAVGILRDVARALAYAHAEGIVHRDIKPENILLSGGTAVVTDFGIAKALATSRTQQDTGPSGALTTVGTSIGTPAYMAPEQAAGDPDTDHRADLYAWGVIAWELLVGAHPFADKTTTHALIAAQLSQVPPAPSTRRRDVPAALDRLVVRCLAKEPNDRPAGATDILRVLDTVATPGESPAGATPARRSTTRTWRIGIATVIALAAAGTLLLRFRPGGSAGAVAPTARSIAVLPFTDLSPDHAEGYLGDGVAETLINALVNVPGLNVAARTSAFSMREKAADVRAIGKQLGVAAVLIGSIQRAGDQLRVTVQLVQTATGVNLWSQRFDRPAADIFAVQDEVAKAVVAAFQMTPGTEAHAALATGGTKNPAAYEAYLLGRFEWNKRTTAGMVRAADYFKQAIAADSTYAKAWSGLADTYVLFVPNEYDVPGINQDSILTLAEAAARRAMALVPTLGEAYSSLGEILEYRSRWPEATEAFRQGVSLNPGYATGHQWYGYNLMASNRWDEAIREMERARQLDPMSSVIVFSLAAAYDGADRFTEATPLFADGFVLAPDVPYALGFFFIHELLARGVEAGAKAYRHLHVVTTGDSTRAARLERGLLDPATRTATIAEIAGIGHPEHGVALARRLESDEAAIKLVLSIVGTPRARAVVPFSLNIALGPALRANPAMLAVLKKLDYPPMAAGATPAPSRRTP